MKLHHITLSCFTLLLFLLPSIHSECVDCPQDQPVKWTSVQTCGCDFRGPQGPVGTQGPTGATGPRGPFGPSSANPLSPSSSESIYDFPHTDIFSIISSGSGGSIVKNSNPVLLPSINGYADSVVRIIVSANIVDRCPPANDEASLTGTCQNYSNSVEGANDLTFIYQLYAANGALINDTFTDALFLDSQIVQFQPILPDTRNIVLVGVVSVGALSDFTNRFLYLNVAFVNPSGLSPDFQNRRMAIDAVVSLLGFPLSLNSKKKKDLDQEYRNYFLEEAISPRELEESFL